VDHVAVKQTRADTNASSASFKVERKHVRGFDCSRRREPRADRFAAAGETSEVMKPDAAGDHDVRKIFERAIDFDRCAAFRGPQRN